MRGSLFSAQRMEAAGLDGVRIAPPTIFFFLLIPILSLSLSFPHFLLFLSLSLSFPPNLRLLYILDLFFELQGILSSMILTYILCPPEETLSLQGPWIVCAKPRIDLLAFARFKPLSSSIALINHGFILSFFFSPNCITYAFLLLFSAFDGWGFTPALFAQAVAARLGIAADKLAPALWGDYFLAKGGCRQKNLRSLWKEAKTTVCSYLGTRKPEGLMTKQSCVELMSSLFSLLAFFFSFSLSFFAMPDESGAIVKEGARDRGKTPIFVSLVLQNIWEIYNVRRAEIALCS